MRFDSLRATTLQYADSIYLISQTGDAHSHSLLDVQLLAYFLPIRCKPYVMDRGVSR
jgi:hypothetical protein